MAFEKFNIFDPLENLPYEICEKIFKYLPVKNLLKASLVNSNWYKFIANNSKLMSKVKVKTSCNMDQDYSQEIIVALTMSERKYENIEIERCGQCWFPIFGLLESKKWKFVNILRTSFTHPAETVDFFRCIEQNVENLQMNGVYVRYSYSDGLNKGLMFPNLKRFSAKHVQAFLYHEIFQNLQHLEHFEIISNDQNIASLNTVIKFLTVNENLKSLQISGNVFYQIMYESNLVQKVPFHLKKLVISNGNYHQGSSYYEQIYDNLVTFIKSQSNSLESISLDDWMGENVLTTIYELPKLKELSIKGFTNCIDTMHLKKINLNVNTSIRKLELFAIAEDQLIFESLMRATPALKNLSLSLLNHHFLDTIKQSGISLTHLTVYSVNLTHIESKDLFKKLEFLSIKDYRLCLRENIFAQSYENLSLFEKMLHAIMSRNL
ncbi:hypothetical protein PVAND_007525 [Polypedilum vanderplanki]|uniref:F-box domain-containing protein n=1 Tax=Polypedilum vanderplanki TaxID=319348 RepID=A0A9J6C7K8_POLVA|nr:hypothetical protein PVAND_007525 [Polypedilum vanderplanki]